MLIGKRIRDLRKTKNLSQQELGDMIGVTKVSISGYETGVRTPSIETLLLLMSTFGVSADYLLGTEKSIISEDTHEYVGAMSEVDIEICKELKRNIDLYNFIIDNPKRSITLINKKLKL